MKTKRERLQVIHDILKAIQQGKIKPTHIMYKANLSHQMLEDYIKDLKGRGLIDENKSSKGRIYALTQKGYEYLSKYTLITNFIESFGLD